MGIDTTVIPQKINLNDVVDNSTIEVTTNKLNVKNLGITNTHIANSTITDAKLDYGTLVKLYDWTATAGATAQDFNIPANTFAGKIIISLVKGTAGSTTFSAFLRYNDITTSTYVNHQINARDSTTPTTVYSTTNGIELCSTYSTAPISHGVFDFNINANAFRLFGCGEFLGATNIDHRQTIGKHNPAGNITLTKLNFWFPNSMGAGTNIKIYKYT